jgi:membrane protein YdbS with pleckstrin-like domain
MAKIYCSNCGQLIPESSNFCRYCGAAQHGEMAAVYRAEAPPLPQPTQPVPEVSKVGHTRKLLLKQHEVIGRRHLDPRAVWLFFINYNLRMFIVFPAFAAGIYFEPLVALLLLAYLIMVYMIALLAYNHFWFSIDEQAFHKEYGIIHKRRVSLPFRQIQNVNVVRTFIDRLLGIAKVEVETAGSSSVKRRDIIGGVKSKAEGVLPGTDLEYARHIHDVLLFKKEYQHNQDNDA